ncbi:MAG: glycosyltransferase family 4 protein [Tepidisphaeraceae bacterium]
MKIALVILHADPSRGGAERYTHDLGAALATAGHDAAILADTFAEAQAGVNQIELDSRALTRSGRYGRFLDSLDAHLGATRYDIVHAMLPVRQCDVYHPHAGLAAAAFGGARRKMSAIFNPRRLRFAAVERSLIIGASPPVVLCLSEYVKRAVAQRYASADLAALFNAVDLSRFEPAPRREGNNVNGLFVGQDFHRKGLSSALSGLKNCEDRRLRLTVVGKPDPSPYRQWASRNGILDRITFAGPARDTRPFYRDADFLVLPTRHDPCSLVVLEALAMGIPVISTTFNGACEIMTNGVHGFVLDDPDDIDALADAMRRMLDPELRARMSRACLALRPKLSYEHHLATLLLIYQRIIANRNV